METKVIYRSVYTEISHKGYPFKSRSDYNIDWDKVIDISKKCGLITVTEYISGGRLTRITLWERETSYTEWLMNSYIQQYINERDEYNKLHNITNTLIFEKANED